MTCRHGARGRTGSGQAQSLRPSGLASPRRGGQSEVWPSWLQFKSRFRVPLGLQGPPAGKALLTVPTPNHTHPDPQSLTPSPALFAPTVHFSPAQSVPGSLPQGQAGLPQMSGSSAPGGAWFALAGWEHPVRGWQGGQGSENRAQSAPTCTLPPGGHQELRPPARLTRVPSHLRPRLEAGPSPGCPVSPEAFWQSGALGLGGWPVLGAALPTGQAAPSLEEVS